MQIWHFGCDRQSLVVCAKNNQLAQIVYWGTVLPDAQDLSALVAACEWDVTGGMLDENPALRYARHLPQFSRTFCGGYAQCAGRSAVAAV
jgi:alpha-galactosidase